jgi:hypothetical protein
LGALYRKGDHSQNLTIAEHVVERRHCGKNGWCLVIPAEFGDLKKRFVGMLPRVAVSSWAGARRTELA